MLVGDYLYYKADRYFDANPMIFDIIVAKKKIENALFISGWFIGRDLFSFKVLFLHRVL